MYSIKIIIYHIDLLHEMFGELDYRDIAFLFFDSF